MKQTEKLAAIHGERNIMNEKIAELIVDDLKNHGPTGDLHIDAVCKVIRKPIRVWRQGRIVGTFGKKSGRPMDVEFKDPEKGRTIGHYNLKGGKYVVTSKHLANDCLFDVISAQTGYEAQELREATARHLKRNFKSLESVVRFKKDIWMLGGAIYSGRSPSDAGRVIDKSQSGRSHPDNYSGHPRGHASHPNPASVGSQGCVENYSMSRWRSGFLSRQDQDYVCHLALQNRWAQEMMDRLNENSTSKDAAHISVSQLDSDQLPMANIWNNGIASSSPQYFHTTCLVVKHFWGQQNNRSEDVFIVTFYPEI